METENLASFLHKQCWWIIPTQSISGANHRPWTPPKWSVVSLFGESFSQVITWAPLQLNSMMFSLSYLLLSCSHICFSLILLIYTWKHRSQFNSHMCAQVRWSCKWTRLLPCAAFRCMSAGYQAVSSAVISLFTQRAEQKQPAGHFISTYRWKNKPDNIPQPSHRITRQKTHWTHTQICDCMREQLTCELTWKKTGSETQRLTKGGDETM